jgi:hypothetical protein
VAVVVARQHKLVERKDFAKVVVVELVKLVSDRELVEEHKLVVVVKQLFFAAERLVFELELVVESISWLKLICL